MTRSDVEQKVFDSRVVSCRIVSCRIASQTMGMLALDRIEPKDEEFGYSMFVFELPLQNVIALTNDVTGNKKIE